MKLEYYGIKGVAKCWFEYYLRNRKQIVKFNSIYRKKIIVLTGVPYFNTRPLLFILYKNDIKIVVKLFQFFY